MIAKEKKVRFYIARILIQSDRQDNLIFDLVKDSSECKNLKNQKEKNNCGVKKNQDQIFP